MTRSNSSLFLAFLELTAQEKRSQYKTVATVHTSKLALIRAHPDLGSKAKMAEASVQEQAGVGLDRLSLEEFTRFETLNQAYRDKFGFPFIIAVKDQTKESILLAFETRLKNDISSEIEAAITEISRIAELRLEAILKKE